MLQISDKQVEVFKVLAEMEGREYHPCIDDIAKAIGKSWATARYHVERLVDAGLVTRIPAHSRSMRIVK